MTHITTPIVLYLRVAGVLLALCVASTSFAETPDAAVSEAQLEAFFERSAADLDAKVRAKTDALVNEALSATTAALRENSKDRLTRLIRNRVDTELAARTNDSIAQLLARQPLRGNTSKTLASRR